MSNEVRIRINFILVTSIDTRAQKFNAEALIEARWIRNRGGTKDLDPQLSITNIEHIIREKIWRTTRKIDIDSTEICLHWRIRGVFFENMELQKFPRDIQDISISVTSNQSERDIAIICDEENISTFDTKSFRCIEEWRPFKHVELCYQPCRDTLSSIELLNTAATVTGKCRVMRKSKFFVINNVAIMFCIASLSLTIFSFDPAYNTFRMATAISLLLVAMTFKTSASGDLPVVPYLTYLDLYMLADISYHVILVLMFAMLSIVKDTDIAKEWDVRACSILVILIVVFHAYFFYIFTSTSNRIVKELERKDEEYMQKLLSMSQCKEKNLNETSIGTRQYENLEILQEYREKKTHILASIDPEIYSNI